MPNRSTLLYQSSEDHSSGKNTVSVFIVGLTLCVLIFYFVAVFYFPTLYVIGTYEDLYGEWGQTYGFGITCFFSTLLACQKNHAQRWFFMLLAAASFYVVMEEISWGQRLIGFETPQFFHDNSYQDEANIHNLLTGPVDAWTKTILTYGVAFALLCYAVFLPLALRVNFKPARWLNDWRLAAEPPMALMPAFIFAAILEIEPFSFNEAEIAELLVAWSLAFTALTYWLQSQSTDKPALFPYFLVLLVGVSASWGTTTLLINSPSQRTEINDRLTNGFEKFVDRYEGYEYPFGVVEMLKQFDRMQPNNTVILRKIADNYELLGDFASAKLYLQKAVDEALQRLAKDPESIQANVSIAKSYRKLGDFTSMVVYADRAYNIALKRQQAEPDHAYWAYWLAKACEQTNRQEDALKFFRLAHQLEPESSRYEDAYQQKKQIMIEYEE